MGKYILGPKILTLQSFCDYYAKRKFFFIMNGPGFPPDMHSPIHIGLRTLNDICDLIANGRLCVAMPCETSNSETCPSCDQSNTGDNARHDIEIEKPCEQTCQKCGSSDIHREFVFKGTRIAKANGTYLDTKCSMAKDIIRSHCRCCQYEWDTNPLS